MDTLEYIEKIKAKHIGQTLKVLREDTIFKLAKETLQNMFTYKDLPDSIPEEYMEKFITEDGMAAVWRLEDPTKEGSRDYTGKLIVSVVDLGPDPDPYGRGTRPIASTLNGVVKHFDNFDEIAVGFNNRLHTSDLPFIKLVAHTLTELFTSLDTNVIYARDKKVFRAHDDKEKRAIEEAYQNIVEDKPVVIVSDNVLKLLQGSEEQIELLDITDVKNSDKLQYIVKAIDDVIRLAYTLYGQAVQGNGKLAQQSVEEVQGNTSTSFILPNGRLAMRQRWVDDINKKFGTNISVEFSDAWKVEQIKYEKMADIDENGELEEMEDADLTDGSEEKADEGEPEVKEEEEEKKDE